jgi:hypothetical protein
MLVSAKIMNSQSARREHLHHFILRSRLLEFPVAVVRETGECTRE